MPISAVDCGVRPANSVLGRLYMEGNHSPLRNQRLDGRINFESFNILSYAVFEEFVLGYRATFRKSKHYYAIITEA